MSDNRDRDDAIIAYKKKDVQAKHPLSFREMFCKTHFVKTPKVIMLLFFRGP
jgi:hypothetical protein